MPLSILYCNDNGNLVPAWIPMSALNMVLLSMLLTVAHVMVARITRTIRIIMTITEELTITMGSN